ncbi:hypothetical protein F4810DRAFT_142302 [Camillea tinctor]|nr:hypothetical protein F4810DRAFT_142302 [Camillea tinctor]
MEKGGMALPFTPLFVGCLSLSPVSLTPISVLAHGQVQIDHDRFVQRLLGPRALRHDGAVDNARFPAPVAVQRRAPSRAQVHEAELLLARAGVAPFLARVGATLPAHPRRPPPLVHVSAYREPRAHEPQGALQARAPGRVPVAVSARGAVLWRRRVSKKLVVGALWRPPQKTHDRRLWLLGLGRGGSIDDSRSRGCLCPRGSAPTASRRPGRRGRCTGRRPTVIGGG